MIKKLSMLFILACSFTSCVAVKEYEKVNINDPDMALADKAADLNVSACWC